MLRSLVVLGALAPGAAYACGCFTPPDPTVPVVQAGERILFAVKAGQVTAHIQVQYQGAAGDFGWLLPLPAVPQLELGVDELFTALTTATQPKYRMTTTYESSCGFLPGTGGSSASGGGTGGGSSYGGVDAGVSTPVVVESSVGPYDYAVLKADSKDEMLQWLADNHYFVPAGTDAVVAPYIRPGGFFLALKLRPGHGTGDLQPVVLRYASDVGMIPITLTGTGATDNMAVQVWMLGQGRAIPRNYHHTVINDAAIDWPSAGSNYEAVIIRAAGEAPGKHTFVTEYAGTSSVMKNQLAPSWRFGTQADLAAQPDPGAFRTYLFTHGFTFTTALQAILDRYPVYDAAAMAQEIFERIATPTRAAQALLDGSETLTRLYTRISPADMNADPVFSFNPSLPSVANVHQADMHVSCSPNSGGLVGVLRTEQGWRLSYPQGPFGAPALDPSAQFASLRIEILPEEGAPQVVIDHTPMVLQTSPIGPAPDPAEPSPSPMRGCSAAGGLGLIAVAALVLRRFTGR